MRKNENERNVWKVEMKWKGRYELNSRAQTISPETKRDVKSVQIRNESCLNKQTGKSIFNVCFFRLFRLQQNEPIYEMVWSLSHSVNRRVNRH